MEDRQLSLSEFAGLMGVSERTARRWIKSGKLRAYKPGRDYRIPESAVREFVEDSEISPKAFGRSSLEPTLFNGLEDERRAAAMFWVAYIRHVAGRIQAHVEDQDSPAFRDPQVAFFFVEEANHNAADLGRLVDEQASVALEVADVETMQDLFDAFAALGFAIGSASARARLLKAATPEDETARKRAEKAAAEREAVERELSAHLGHSA
jgi:excisionase family DNA binding protein